MIIAKFKRARPTAWKLLLAAFVTALLAASYFINAYNNTPLFYTGRVLDWKTREPIEGAYAMAVYEDVFTGDWMMGGKAYCVKTLGMFVGKDGAYRFPVDTKRWTGPTVDSIHPDYWQRERDIPNPSVGDRAKQKTYTDRNTYLEKIDPQHPPDLSLRSSGTHCTRASTRADVEGAIQYLKVARERDRRLGARPAVLKSWDEEIQDLKNKFGWDAKVESPALTKMPTPK